jgi:hypothetical protein
VEWNGIRSAFITAQYGVQQGSILGMMVYLVHVADMPMAVGVKDNKNSGYADDTAIWAVDRTVEEVVHKLNAIAMNFSTYTKGKGLVLNWSKTRLIFCTFARNVDNATVEVDGAKISPSPTFVLLGIKFDRKFSTAPHLESVAAATEKPASLIRRISLHLKPTGPYMRQLALGIVHGKLSHALGAVLYPRLSDNNTINRYERRIPIQVSINNVARTLTGTMKTEHDCVLDLLDKAKIPSSNAMVIKAVAGEVWNARQSNDGPNGSHNPTGNILLNAPLPTRPWRSLAAGHICKPRGGDV